MGRGKVSVLIKKSSLVFDKYVNQLLIPYNLSASQFRILLKLYKSGGKPVRQVDIETEFAMTTPTVTGLVHQLEKKDEFFALANELEKEMTDGLNEFEVEMLTFLLQKILNRHESK